MPFGLKNAGATYQRLVTKMFRSLLGKTMEVYIDDMLVKFKERLDHTTHLQHAFELLREYNMKLNPTKCRPVLGIHDDSKRNRGQPLSASGYFRIPNS